jgi:hypothetical protein
MSEYLNNAKYIFSKENLNKIESIRGENYRNALEDSLYRMQHGTNRPSNTSNEAAALMTFMNGAVGATMFLNTRSATLQLLSTANYINWTDNNPLMAGKAFLNAPQFWSDFAMIWNSPMMKQRRSGLKHSVAESEIAMSAGELSMKQLADFVYDIKGGDIFSALKGTANMGKGAVAYLLKKGFTPTQIADSLAIATGGASFYRNRLNTYLNKGKSQKEAETKAWADFMEQTQKAQQSSMAHLVSRQQASSVGRVLLNWANTPMQFARIQEKEARDIINGRFEGIVMGDNSLARKAGKIAWYGAIQSAIFAGLQSALFAVYANGDDLDVDWPENPTDINKLTLEERDELITEAKERKAGEKTDKIDRVVNTMLDSQLKGLGVLGVAISTLKNTYYEYVKQSEKGAKSDSGKILIAALSGSPVLGSKSRKFHRALEELKYNKEAGVEMGWDIDNPMYDVVGTGVESITNVPTQRINTKINNLRAAADASNAAWQRIFSFMGWSNWELGIESPSRAKVDKIKKQIKEDKKAVKDAERDVKKAEKRVEKEAAVKAQEEAIKKLQDNERELGGVVGCGAVNMKGKRCSKTVKEGKNYCTIHERVPQRASGTKFRCKHIKPDGSRCKIKTTNKSLMCYYHD